MHTRAYTYIYDKLILHLDKKPQVIVVYFTFWYAYYVIYNFKWVWIEILDEQTMRQQIRKTNGTLLVCVWDFQ